MLNRCFIVILSLFLVAAAAGGAAARAGAVRCLDGHRVAAVHRGVDDGVNVADHRLALFLGGVVAHHTLTCHDLAVQRIDALVQLCHAGGVGFGLGALVVQVQTGKVKLADQILQLGVVVVFAARGVQLKITGVGLQGSGGLFKKINAIHR